MLATFLPRWARRRVRAILRASAVLLLPAARWADTLAERAVPARWRWHFAMVLTAQCPLFLYLLYQWGGPWSPLHAWYDTMSEPTEVLAVHVKLTLSFGSAIHGIVHGLVLVYTSIAVLLSCVVSLLLRWPMVGSAVSVLIIFGFDS